MRKLIGIVLVLWTSILFGQTYGDYYQSAEGLKGDALKAQLNFIIKGHTEFPYTATSTDVWDILKQTDKDPNNSENVILLYSGQSYNAALEYNSGAGWSREHTWAKSRGDFGTEPGAGTDVHHLRPEDVSVNSTRNNRPFDVSGTRVEVWDNGLFTGSYIDDNDYTFEPRDAVKGDVARMLFYMAVRYEGEGDEPDLELTELLLSNTDISPLHGKLSTLLAWHRADPVDDWERNRNEIIFTDFQHNRNPFIDIPELVEFIWGNAIDLTWPSALSTFPKDGETDIAINTTIKFVFNNAIRNIDDSEINDTNVASLISLKETDASGEEVPFSASIDADKKVITVSPSAPLKSLQLYYAALNAVEDENENVNAFTEINFTTIALDETAPTFSSTPTHLDVDVDILTPITLRFDEAIRNIDDSEITNDNLASLLILKETDASGADVAYTATIDFDKKLITATISEALKNNQIYYAAIDAVEDASNNAMDATFMTFTTIADVDPPTFSSSPVDGSTDVNVSNNITLSFNEAIRNIDDSEISTINVSDLLTFKEGNSSGNTVSFSASIDDAKQIITIIPSVDLLYDEIYYIALASVEDYADNALDLAEFSFTTAAQGMQMPFWTLNFEVPGGYTTSVAEFSDLDPASIYSGYDYFLRTDGSDIGPNVAFTNRLGSYYFGAQDLDGEGATLPLELNIDDIDISGKTVSEFRIYLAEDLAADGGFDWDASDYVKFQYDLDNSGVFTDLFWVASNGSTNTQPSIDADFNGIGDGIIFLSAAFTEISIPVNLSGSTLDIKVIFDMDDGDTDIAIDNLSLFNDQTATGIDIPNTNELKIYPNPNKGVFFVQLGDSYSINTKIVIYNSLGVQVYETLAQENKTEIDLSDMKRGIYFIRVTDGNQTRTQKIIKQ